MSPEEWNDIKEYVTDAMIAHTRCFVTPLTRGTETTVRLEGSGSYVEVKGRRLLLSCEHVAKRGQLGYRFYGSNEVFRCHVPWTMEPHPVDMAFLPISDADWTATRHEAAAIPYGRFATKHQIIEQAELLFFRGYAGENANYGFGMHQANATGYGSQEKLDSGDAFNFEIFWEPENTQFTKGTSMDARPRVKFDDAQGFSGSLIWNTRYLETLAAGRSWRPEDAVITGLLRRWDTATKTLLAYRVEHVRGWLDRQEVT